MTKQFLAKDTLETIEILILADASSVDTVTSILKQADLPFSWHQAANLTEYHNISAPINLVLYDANLRGISLNKAIAFFFSQQSTNPRTGY